MLRKIGKVAGGGGGERLGFSNVESGIRGSGSLEPSEEATGFVVSVLLKKRLCDIFPIHMQKRGSREGDCIALGGLSVRRKEGHY